MNSINLFNEFRGHMASIMAIASIILFYIKRYKAAEFYLLLAIFLR